MNENPFYRILKASVLLGFSLFTIFVYPKAGQSDEQFFHGITNYLASILGKNWGENIGNIAMIGFYILVLLGFVRGIYFLITWQQKNPVFENNTPWWVEGIKTGSGYGNLYKVMEYRESRLRSLPPDLAASEFLASSWVDGIAQNSNTKGVQKSLSFLDSKLAGMSAADGYEFIKNNPE